MSLLHLPLRQSNKIIRMRKGTGLLFVLTLLVSTLYAQKVKVACVGNSVTYGAAIKNREVNCYPNQLQGLLGDAYEVGNFGHSGATVMRNGHKPYWEKPEYQKALDFAPDKVIIHLGLNDMGNNNWPNHKNEFVQDYTDLINSFRNLPSKPEVWICRMTTLKSGHRWFEEGMREAYWAIQDSIEVIAERQNVPLIDLHDPLYRFPEYMADQLHPTKEGAAMIADKVYGALTGDFGGLQLPLLYGDGMILQRNETIKLNGTANAGQSIAVALNGIKASTVTNDQGKWAVELPAMKAGGPYELKITAEKEVVISDVHLGEVWLASGQSNMYFAMKSSKDAKKYIEEEANPNIKFFTMRACPKKRVYAEETLEKLHADKYFLNNGWETASAENLKNFSAVAYAFAAELQKELGVAVGVVSNSVGGSTTQSWISRETMEQEHIMVDMLNDTYMHPLVQPWCNGRKAVNLKNAKGGMHLRHHFDPTFLFDSGIYPIRDYNFKGVIWYQGESNADQISLHDLLFTNMVADWRMHFNKPELPFYYVQLSSLNRPTWPRFRDAQRRLMYQIPNTGMAVSTDVGNPKDVHPKDKWPVGERLSRWALAEQYGVDVVKSGPLFAYFNIDDDEMEVHFDYAEGLKTLDGAPLRGFEIAGADGVFHAAKGKIKGDKVILKSDKVEAPRWIRYAWEPYTEANLCNEAGIPASTFSNEYFAQDYR